MPSPSPPATRLTLCLSCRSVIEGPWQATELLCDGCGAAAIVPPREEDALRVPRSRPGSSEAERRARLARQDGQPLLPPEELRGLLDGGRLAEWKVAEALELWVGTHRELTAAPNPAAERRLMFLNLMLANRHGTDDPRLVRALREGALDVVTLSRHRQELMADLARAVAEARRYAEASFWLGLLDDRSDDLAVDSAYRYATAFVASLHGDQRTVLDALGENLTDVPLADQYDPIAALLRADAHERLGQVDVATDQLVGALDAGHQTSLEHIMTERGRRFGWCPESFERAVDRYGAAAARRLERSAGAMGRILIGVAVIELLTAIGMFVGAAVAEVTLLVPGVILTVVGLGIGAWGLRSRANAKRQARIRFRGRRATGTILALRRTSLTVNGVPQMELTVEVRAGDAAPYEAKLEMLLRPEAAAGLQPGTTIGVRVDPDDQRFIVPEN